MSVQKPAEQFADLLELRRAFEAASDAQEKTIEAIKLMESLSSLAPAEESTIKKLNAQLKKFDTLVKRARKALNVATKKKVPQELADFYKKEMKVLKKTLGASVFSNIRYGFRSNYSNRGQFYIAMDLLDWPKPIEFRMSLRYDAAEDGHYNWRRNWIPAKPARITTEMAIILGRYNTPETGERALAILRDNQYKHYPNMDAIKNKIEEDKKYLEGVARRLSNNFSTSVEEYANKAQLEVTFRSDMRWEYDQESMSRSDWEEQADKEVEWFKNKVTEIVGSDPKIQIGGSSGVGEKGHIDLYITMKG